LTSGDATKNEFYLNMEITEINKIQIIKSKDLFLQWYSSEIQKPKQQPK